MKKTILHIFTITLVFEAICIAGCGKPEHTAVKTHQAADPQTVQNRQAEPQSQVDKSSQQQEMQAMQMQEPVQTAPDSAADTSSRRYADGTYTALSSIKDDWGGSAEVTVTIKDDRITGCTFVSYEKNGAVKDEDYGKTDGIIKNAGLYRIAQAAIEKAAQYGPRLVETQQLDEVDAIAGATVSYRLFQNAVGIALQQASEAVK